MYINDNILKQYLKNVYFITGTACGGKTTASKVLAKKYGFIRYDEDEEFNRHLKISNPVDQPDMNKQFRDADEFFGRSADEYYLWLKNNAAQQFEFVIIDLIRMSQNKKIIFDGVLTVRQIQKLADYSNVAFLIKQPGKIVDEYRNRPDHQDFNNFINSASDVEAAKETCNAALGKLNNEIYEDVVNSGYFYIERTASSTVEKTVAELEKHFGFDGL